MTTRTLPALAGATIGSIGGVVLSFPWQPEPIARVLLVASFAVLGAVLGAAFPEGRP